MLNRPVIPRARKRDWNSTCDGGRIVIVTLTPKLEILVADCRGKRFVMQALHVQWIFDVFDAELPIEGSGKPGMYELTIHALRARGKKREQVWAELLRDGNGLRAQIYEDQAADQFDREFL